MSFEKYLKEDARLVILILLAGMDDRKSNEHLLQRLAEKYYGHTLSRDQLRTELAWLEEQGLIRNQKGADTWVSTVLRRGEEVAKGVVVVPGVQRPAADEE